MGGNAREARDLAQHVAGEFRVDLLAVAGRQPGPACGGLRQLLLIGGRQRGLQARRYRQDKGRPSPAMMRGPSAPAMPKELFHWSVVVTGSKLP